MIGAQTITILVQVASFIAAAAAIFGAVIMFQVTKKFGTGILASGFRNIASGVLFIALGIIIDALTSSLFILSDSVYTGLLFLIKAGCFVTGTYMIVIASKKTADGLENITK